MKTLDRMGVIRQSLAVFYFGIAGLLPAFGLLPATAALRIATNGESLSVSAYSIAALFPVAGLIPASYALVRGFRVRRAYAATNPANNYRKLGMALGAFCILINGFAAMIIVANLLSAAQEAGYIE